jgi:hypothetical protein
MGLNADVRTIRGRLLAGPVAVSRAGAGFQLMVEALGLRV